MKSMKEIMTSAVVLIPLMVFSINPITLSLALLVMSILSTTLIFKVTTSSWLAFILVITFSSGMLTLFFYTTTLVPNEINKPKKSVLMPALLSLVFMFPMPPHANKTHVTMKFFSSYAFIIMMALILVLTLLAISTHGYNPNQALRSSF